MHTKKEGEGDLSLKYWGKVHKEFFKSELMLKDKKFSENLLIVLEEFEVKSLD